MDTPIVFTPSQLVGVILAVCGAIVTISAAVTIILKIIEKAKEPEKAQNARIETLERKFASMHSELESFKLRNKNEIDNLEEGNKVTQRAILALLSHSIDGNNEKQMIDARDELNEYLLGGKKHKEDI